MSFGGCSIGDVAGFVVLQVQVWQNLLVSCIGGEGCHPSGIYSFSSTQVVRLSWFN